MKINLNNDEDEQHGIDVLSSFSSKYSPATKEDVTDLFSSKEIQKMIFDFTGVGLQITTIYKLMLQMGYTYQMEENNFIWMVKKDD